MRELNAAWLLGVFTISYPPEDPPEFHSPLSSSAIHYEATLSETEHSENSSQSDYICF
jgi:hypothetical protein